MRNLCALAALMLVAGCGGGGGGGSASATTGGTSGSPPVTPPAPASAAAPSASVPAPSTAVPGAPDMSSLQGQAVPADQVPVMRDGEWRLTSERGTRDQCVSDQVSRRRWNFVGEIVSEGRNCQPPQYSRVGNILTGRIQCENVTANETVGGDFDSTVTIAVEVAEVGREPRRMTVLAQRMGDCPTN